MLKISAIVPATDDPATLSACVAAIRAAREPPDEVIVVVEADGPGPAAARNRGAGESTGDVLVFVDSDVVVHENAFSLLRQAFEEPDLVGVFGSYDDRPAAPGAVSGFRNLLHHWIHHVSAGPAETFWAGLGAIRRDPFVAAGGFDERRFPRPSVEDVELGMRLAAAGSCVRLDPRIQGTHLKAWTLTSMVTSDLFARAVPWLRLLLRARHGSTALNLGAQHRLSAAASLGIALALIRRNPRSAAAGALVLVALNHDFYALLARRRGLREAALGVALHGIHHLTGIVALPIALGAHLWEVNGGRRRGRP